MKSSCLKIVVGCGATVGAACGVGFPLSALDGTKDHVTNEIVVQGGENEGCLAFGSTALLDTIKDQKIDFGQLWSRLKRQLNKENLCKELPFKEELENILKTVSSTQNWIVKEEAWEGCSGDKPCGYLELETDHKKGRIKLLITFDEQNSNRKEWKLRIIKTWNNGEPSYYDGYPDTTRLSTPAWITINNAQWRNFSMSTDSWNQLEHFSIIKSTT